MPPYFNNLLVDLCTLITFHPIQPYFQALASRGHRLTLVTWVPDDEFCDMGNVECVRVGTDLSSFLESKNFFTGEMTIFGELLRRH